MPSTHERALVQIATQSMSIKPPMAAAVAEYCRQLNDGRFKGGYVDSLCQKPWGAFDFYDAWGFAQLHYGLCTGKFVSAKIWVGHAPTKDSQAEENNRRLSGLPEPFQARFRGGPGDHDGRLLWEQKIEVGQRLPDGANVRLQVSPSHVPLEVGYTTMSRTLVHLAQDGGVARWPYDQEYISLYLNRQHHSAASS